MGFKLILVINLVFLALACGEEEGETTSSLFPSFGASNASDSNGTLNDLRTFYNQWTNSVLNQMGLTGAGISLNGSDHSNMDFNCSGRHHGYYADVQKNCQIFHLCYKTQDAYFAEESTSFEKITFSCDHGMRFDQKLLACSSNGTESTDCESSPEFFNSSNAKLEPIFHQTLINPVAPLFNPVAPLVNPVAPLLNLTGTIGQAIIKPVAPLLNLTDTLGKGLFGGNSSVQSFISQVFGG